MVKVSGDYKDSINCEGNLGGGASSNCGSCEHGDSSFSESQRRLPGSFIAQIKILSESEIIASSYGEVTESKTINYRTLKPEKDGLFCAKIFGPIKDYQCLCGKYDKIKYKGIICEKCGVEITLSSVRRYRSGHIKLAVEVVNPLFLKSSKITDLLDITKTTLSKILSFDNYLVLDGGNTPLKRFQILSKNEFEEAEEKYGNFSFKADYGAKAIDIALNSLDLREEYDILNEKLKSGEIKSEIKLANVRKRMRTIKDFCDSGINPSSMILKSIIVMPPELRPLMQLEGKTIISDINSLYANLIDRNNRLKKLTELEAPEIIIQNEKRMVSEACSNLIIGSNVSTRLDRPPLKSLTDSFKGKQGRFRQNLLGKRVDYSGRAVIVVGPGLKLDECKIPKDMALELFRPFLISKLCLFGHASSMYSANILIDEKNIVVWDILEQITKENYVLLNRAPTLHRLGVQAFKILLSEDEAIHLHPLTCKAFNADFDGDQMGVHLPLTLEAQIEARILMLSSSNIVNVANGEIIVTPRKDIVLGLYYLTLSFDDEKQDVIRDFYSYHDILSALEAKIVHYNTKIKYHFKYALSEVKDERNRFREIITTPGRVKLFNLIENDGKIKFEDWNVAFGMDQVNAITRKVYEVYGDQKTVQFLDQIMYLGFKFATLSSVSISATDLKVPKSKSGYISNAIGELLKIEEQYKDGIITLKEKENKITDVWSKTSNLIADDLKKEISKNDQNKSINSLSLMIKSGSRVSMIQLLQICGMKGLVTTTSLGVIYTAVISSYIEGLNLIEFFISAYGARKGNVDSALKTPFTGYFARKLATVAQSCVIVKHSCGTKNGITYQAKNFDFKQDESLADVAFGRVLAEDIIVDDKVILKFGDLIDKEKYHKLKNINLKEIKLKSPITCEEEFGICSECYGYDIITNSLATVGTATGIIAAQSIGEPGTQLTLRTFHSGGATSKVDTDFDFVAPFDGTLSFKEDQLIKLENHSIFIGHGLNIDLKGENKDYSYTLSHGAKIYFKSGNKVKAKSKIADWDPYNSYIFAEEDGLIKFEDLVRQLSYNEIFDDATGKSSKVIINWLENAKNLRPNVCIADSSGHLIKNSANYEAKYYLSSGMILMKQEGEQVKKGDMIARIPKEVSGFQKDITGGLPRVQELFEARIPESCSVISPCDARVQLVDSSSSKNKIILHSIADDKEYAFSVLKDKCILFKNGSFVNKGDIICDGDINPHDLLIAQGIDGLSNYLLTEILKVYILQGVVIQVKHVEVIIRYMLRKVEITYEGDCTNEDIKVGSRHFIHHIKKINKKLVNEGKKPVEFELVLQGITKASLSPESFIEAATFQEPLKTLTEAACVAKIDPLIGIKENLVIGNLTPTGTGVSVRNMCFKV